MTNILIGPLKRDSEFKNIMQSYEILGDFAAKPEIMTFEELDLTVESEEIDLSFEKVINDLPHNWKPDVIVFWGIDQQIIPEDIEKIDCPLIGVIIDWHKGFEACANVINKFDWVFTDIKGKKILNEAGFENVSDILLAGYNPLLHKKIDYYRKDIDISFIGTIDNEMLKDRSKWVHKLSLVSDRFNVSLGSAYGDDYTEYLNKSKISFNYSDKGTINSRCFEAIACGSLLFIEDTNEPAKNLFLDKKDCVFYNSDNFEDLIEHYLDNDDEREQIIKNSLEKFKNYTLETMFSNFVDSLNNLDFKKQKLDRGFLNLPDIEKYKRNAKQALESNVSGKFYFVEKQLQKALKLDRGDFEVLNNLGVIYSNAYFLSDKKDPLLINKSFKLLHNSLAENPTYALARFNLGCIYYMIGDFVKAEDELLGFVINSTTNTESSLKDRGYYCIIPNLSHYSEMKIAWEMNTYNSYNDEESKSFGYCDILLNKALELIGNIAFQNEDYQRSEIMFKNALQARDDLGYIKTKLGDSLDKQNKLEEANTYYKQMFVEKPYYTNNWLSLLSNLKKLNKLEEFEELCLDILIAKKPTSQFEYYRSLVNKELAEIL